MGGGLNSYTYASNNPVNAIDPLGLCEEGQAWKSKGQRGECVPEAEAGYLPGNAAEDFVENCPLPQVKGAAILGTIGKRIISKVVPNSAVWKLKPRERGNAIEAALAKSDYKDWYNVGKSHNGYFPLVDFQKGNTLVSLKSVDTTGSSWLGRMQSHIDDLATRGATVNGQKASMVLDLRVQPGGANSASSLIQYGRQQGVNVMVKEF